MNIRPIHTEQDYQDALKAVSPLFDNEPEPGTPEGDYLEVMITLIEAYEGKHFPVDLPNPLDAIRFRMEQSGLSATDLVPAVPAVSHSRPGALCRHPCNACVAGTGCLVHGGARA